VTETHTGSLKLNTLIKLLSWILNSDFTKFTKLLKNRVKVELPVTLVYKLQEFKFKVLKIEI
jgi:hypothetical protein